MVTLPWTCCFYSPNNGWRPSISVMRSRPSLWTYLELLIQYGILPCSPNCLPMESMEYVCQSWEIPLCLCLPLSHDLSWANYISKLVSKASFQLGFLRHAKSILGTSELLSTYKAFICSLLEYWSPHLGWLLWLTTCSVWRHGNHCLQDHCNPPWWIFVYGSMTGLVCDHDDLIRFWWRSGSGSISENYLIF